MMKSISVVLVLGCSLVCGAEPFVLHVAPNGADTNPGTVQSPLATPAGARDALRAYRAKQGGTLPKGGAIIEFADGVYPFTVPLELDRRDAGAATKPVVWRAANRTKAIFSGAFAPTGWHPVDDPAVRALLPPNAREHVLQADLPAEMELPGFTGGGCGTPGNLQEIPLSVFADGTRLTCARGPNEDFLRTGRNVGTAEKRHDAQFCRSGVFEFASDRLSIWAKEPELWAYGLWCYEWADAKTRVKAIDVDKGTITVDPAPIGFGIRVNAQFYLINALSELDRPGEWVIDRAKRRLYVWPTGTVRPVLAVAPGLVKGRDLSDVSFEGFTFEYARLTALSIDNGIRCAVRSSVVRHTSSWALRFAGGAEGRVEGCNLYDLGEGGVTVQGGDRTKLTPANHIVDNNEIHHYGQIVPNYRPGVSLNGVGNRCTHNLIHHTLHQAVGFDGNDHTIGYNVVHDTCMFNDDAGAIYACARDWTKRGSVIEYNLVYFTGKKPRATHTPAIYLDDFTSGVTIRGNIVNRASEGLYIGGGQDNTVERNLFVNCNWGPALGSRGIETFAKNISLKGRESGMFKVLERGRTRYSSAPWSTRYPNMMRVFDFPDAQHAHDAHFNRITSNVCVFGDVRLGNWTFVKDTCTVTNNLSLDADPGFVDYANFDWRLKPGPARDLVGELPLEQMGLYASPLRVSPPVRFGADVTPPPPPRKMYEPATVRIDLVYNGNLPTNIAEIASDCLRCTVPDWSRGKRVMASFGTASLERWKDYSFTFTPLFDQTLIFETMGARGEKTLYDDFRITGSTLRDGGFEGTGVWRGGAPMKGDYRAPVCNLARPYGILTAVEAGVPAAEGVRMACGSDMINFSQVFQVKKGVPVTISFKARALPLASN